MREIVLMFCGPHATNAWSPLYHRIDHAITVALERSIPLAVAGDCFGGRAVAHFADRALTAGVRSVHRAFDPGGYTQSDARAAAEAFATRPELAVVSRVYVVTDDWHAERCLVMIAGECRARLPGRAFHFVSAPTRAGPRPPEQQLLFERFGIEDYLAGRPRAPRGDPFGKPSHSTAGP